MRRFPFFTLWLVPKGGCFFLVHEGFPHPLSPPINWSFESSFLGRRSRSISPKEVKVFGRKRGSGRTISPSRKLNASTGDLRREGKNVQKESLIKHYLAMTSFYRWARGKQQFCWRWWWRWWQFKSKLLLKWTKLGTWKLEGQIVNELAVAVFCIFQPFGPQWSSWVFTSAKSRKWRIIINIWNLRCQRWRFGKWAGQCDGSTQAFQPIIVGDRNYRWLWPR